MPVAFGEPSSYTDRAPPRRRLVGIVAAVAINLALIAVLLGIAPPLEQVRKQTMRLVSLGLLPNKEEDKKGARAKVKAQEKPNLTQRKSAARAVPVPKPPIRWPSDVIIMSREDMAAADIAKLPQRAATSGEGGNPNASGDAGAGTGRGEGPGGAQLYDVDWYRRPTNAELDFYMPKNRPDQGWGEIVCRTVADYKVEDCQILGESPSGSGYGRAVLNAAWQFRVMPPRVNSRKLLGTWVRIRIDYSVSGVRVR